MAVPIPREPPFHPHRPLPHRLFRGQQCQIERIQTRFAGRVARGGSAAVYLVGQPGIGKTSLAGYLQHEFQRDLDFHPIYAAAGRAETLEQLGAAVLKATPELEGLRTNWDFRSRSPSGRSAQRGQRRTGARPGHSSGSHRFAVPTSRHLPGIVFPVAALPARERHSPGTGIPFRRPERG